MCCGRREFIEIAAAGVAGAALPQTVASSQQRAAPVWAQDLWDARRAFSTSARRLVIKPVLMYTIPRKREMTSWKSWGGIQTQDAAGRERLRIAEELKTAAARADFPVDVLPVSTASTVDEAAAARDASADVTLIYPATGSGALLRACIPEDGNAIIFVRHRSGPVYYWYEALSVRYLRTGRPQPAPPNPADAPRTSVHDVVVDDPGELLWRLRAFYAVKNLHGAKIVALGGARGKYAADAVQVARDRFKLDIIETGYDDFNRRIRSALADRAAVALAERWAERYLSIPGTSLETDRKFIVNSFVLYGAFRDLMKEHGASAFTINSCMGTIMPMAETTACLTLSLLNDEGLLAFCESDFVIVPAGILLRYVSGRPVFLHNSTFPHNGMVTCAHCTSPRRMNGTRYEPARVLTHYESEFGAAPKVEIPRGTEVTFIDPEYATGRWVGIRGVVESNPFYDICRSQQDVRIHGEWTKLLDEVRDSHWVMAYGDWLKEIGYAAPRTGVTWETI